MIDYQTYFDNDVTQDVYFSTDIFREYASGCGGTSGWNGYIEIEKDG